MIMVVEMETERLSDAVLLTELFVSLDRDTWKEVERMQSDENGNLVVFTNECGIDEEESEKIAIV